MNRIKIVLVGEQDIFQDIVRRILTTDPGLELVAEVDRPDRVPEVVTRTHPDVIVVRPLEAEPASTLRHVLSPDGPSVVGVDDRGSRGLLVIDDLAPDELRAAVRARAGVGGRSQPVED